MTGDQESDPRNLTFSQAQGYEPIPAPLALGELSKEARIKLWDLLIIVAWRPSPGIPVSYWTTDDYWKEVFLMLHREFLMRPRDEFSDRASVLVGIYKPAILGGLPFSNVFDLFQMMMRHENCPTYFIDAVATVFRQCRLAYVVDVNQPVTILPAVTPQEGEALVESIKELREAGLSGSVVHLRNAGARVNGGDWPGAVRESIHAVESVARLLAPDANTLSPALAELERGGQLHPALKEAFSRLYGYTSDEEGIRHPLIENAESPVGQDEAVFMLGACASFSSYLWRRHQAEI